MFCFNIALLVQFKQIEVESSAFSNEFRHLMISFKTKMGKKSKAYICVMWLPPINTELGQLFDPRVNHLYNERTWYHCCSLLLSIQITLHGKVRTKNVGDKNVDDSKSSKWKNVDVRDIYVIFEWDEKWKMQINQMKNVYLSNQNYWCRNLDSSDIRPLRGNIIRREKNLMLACPDTLKLDFKAYYSRQNNERSLQKHHTCKSFQLFFSSNDSIFQ